MTRRPRDLCDACRRDLLTEKSGMGDPGIGFCGPLVARRGHGYWVLYHPRAVLLWLGSDLPDWREMKDRVLTEFTAKVGPRGYRWACTAPQDEEDVAPVAAAVEHALHDPDPDIREAARAARKALQKTLETTGATSIHLQRPEHGPAATQDHGTQEPAGPYGTRQPDPP